MAILLHGYIQGFVVHGGDGYSGGGDYGQYDGGVDGGQYNKISKSSEHTKISKIPKITEQVPNFE